MYCSNMCFYYCYLFHITDKKTLLFSGFIKSLYFVHKECRFDVSIFFTKVSCIQILGYQFAILGRENNTKIRKLDLFVITIPRVSVDVAVSESSDAELLQLLFILTT